MKTQEDKIDSATNELEKHNSFVATFRLQIHKLKIMST
jgi:hypothetical protein